MINVSLCDDNPEIMNDYASILRSIAQTHQIPLQIITYTSGEQLLFMAEERLKSMDILYLDLLMGQMGGIQTAQALRKLGYTGKIIFLTSSREHIFEAFDALPLHYIVKQDVSCEKFEAIFLKAVELTREFRKESFVFENKSVLTRVLLEDILYFEVHRHLVFLHMSAQVYSFYSQIDTVEEQLREKYFVRCHRSFVVNLRHLRSIGPQQLTLANAAILPVGSKYLKDLKGLFSHFLESRAIIL